MIRPFTLVCMASAFGAGLYLYQSKHAAQMLDREITRTLKQTEATRERTGMLRAEWALLNEPDRLAELAKAHLSLQTLKPTQFAAMADLGSRLPVPVAAHLEALPAEAEPEAAPVASAPTVLAVPVAVAAAPVAAPAPVKPREVASAESKAKPEPKVEKAAESRPVRAAEKPVLARTEPRGAEPVAVGYSASGSAAARQQTYAPPGAASAEATAPGTVGAAVLRAMRAQGNGYAPAAASLPAAAPAPRSYAPAFVQPASNVPAYSSPAYVTPGYASPAVSVLGGRPALPPPVPFAAR